MEISTRRSLKKTSFEQFRKLVGLMEEFPHLATGVPGFGWSRMEIEKKWDDVTRIVNSLGPPERGRLEWKKTWADLKFRTKKAVAENNKIIEETGDCNDSRVRILTPLESDISRICHFSSATVEPDGDGNENVKRRKLAASSKILIKQKSLTERQSLEDEVASQDLLEPLTKSRTTPPTPTPKQCQPQPTNTISDRPVLLQQRKRKIENEKCQDRNEQMKLLRQQIDLQNAMLDAMKMQTESAEASAEALQDIAESTKMMAKAMMAVAKHFTGIEF